MPHTSRWPEPPSAGPPKGCLCPATEAAQPGAGMVGSQWSHWSVITEAADVVNVGFYVCDTVHHIQLGFNQSNGHIQDLGRKYKLFNW